MFMNRSTKVLVIVMVGLVVGLGILIAAAPTVLGQELLGSRGHTIAIEVAENGTRFAPDETPVFDDGLPAYGGEFITEGYIYPAGTLTCDNNECNGVLEDGSPEFPELVMGKWTCRGWHVGDGAHTTTGPAVVTTQIFDFGDMPGAEMIVTDGFEYADFNVPFLRAIIGGTGQYAKARGEQTQELLGWNPSVGVGLRVELDLSGR